MATYTVKESLASGLFVETHQINVDHWTKEAFDIAGLNGVPGCDRFDRNPLSQRDSLAPTLGFDDVSWMEMVDPPITVVDQPTVEMGRCAARLLLERIRNPGAAPRVEVLQPSLIVRGSTGPPP